MAISLKDCYRKLPAACGDMYIAGGGSVSHFTCEMIAHALGREIIRQNRGELCTRGIVEAVRMGVAGIRPQADISQAERFSPDPAYTKIYDGIYARYTALRESMEAHWQ